VSLLLKLVRVSGLTWLTIYSCFCFVFGLLGNITLHIMMIGLLMAVIAWFRLPPPNPTLVKHILGPDPRPGSSVVDVDWEVAHRAACLDAPENSLEALRLAHRNGAKIVEFDVSFTSCMSPVVFHDDDVERITTGVGKINSISHSNLKKLNLATKHPLGEEFDHVAVPDLDEFVAECVKLNMKMIIDLKTYEAVEETTKAVLGLYTKFPVMRTTAIVTSFFPQLLYSLRSKNSDIVCSVSTRPLFLSSTNFDGNIESFKPRFSGIKQTLAVITDKIYPWLLQHFIWDFVGISAILVHKACVTPMYVSAWRQKGVRVMAWTVNDPLEKAHLRYSLGVQCLTDTLERVKPDNWILRD